MEPKQAKANAYIAEHYDRLCIALPKGRRKEYGELAAARGISLTELIVRVMDRELKEYRRYSE